MQNVAYGTPAKGYLAAVANVVYEIAQHLVTTRFVPGAQPGSRVLSNQFQ
ncbi:MAG: hypothetical protein RIC14_15635 [Filomicrobium sp.]